MKIIALICPQCSAKLEIKDESMKIAHCTHCGYDFLLQKEEPPQKEEPSQKKHDMYKTTVFQYDASKTYSSVENKTTKNKTSRSTKIVLIAIFILPMIIPLAIFLIPYLQMNFNNGINSDILPDSSETISESFRTLPESKIICEDRKSVV